MKKHPEFPNVTLISEKQLFSDDSKPFTQMNFPHKFSPPTIKEWLSTTHFTWDTFDYKSKFKKY